MNKKIEEKISALMDGGLSTSEVDGAVQSLCADELLREQWQRMHLVRDIMQGESPSNYLGSDFSAGVMEALDDDATPVLLPETNVVAIDFAAKQTTSKSSRTWMRPVVGLAIAASVAMVSVVGLRTLQEPSAAGLPLVVSNEQETEFISESSGSPLAFQSTTNNANFKRVNNTGTYWIVDEEKIRNSELEAHLNSYLSDHIEFATMRNVGGMLPYSKLVGYDEIRK